ncbi:Uncharacterized protein FWK35_00038300 [Aphis craccivora]|uniref:Uncharacterized protein n=1 Tax=Aphis craccivora TaxID=307492 RepID=A0A6G0YI53_APHCR|nr:Uncharacterized protein FWK35_00038300 [Aphis craccivora]
MQVFSKNFLVFFIKTKRNKKRKVTEKQKFFLKTSYLLQNRFCFYNIVTQKRITVNTCNFHQMFILVLSI